MLFCPECDSILDISRSAPKKTYNVDNTPSEMTDTDEDKIGIIINKLIKNEKVEIENIKIDQITEHESFKKLDKDKKNSLLSRLDSLLQKQDDQVSSYYTCTTCLFSKKIETGTLVTSIIGGNSQTGYINMDRFKNKVYEKALPFTRNYQCPNKKCKSRTDKEMREAVMYRIGETMRMGYTCTACNTSFVI
jgi:hypothetical protein